MSRHRRLNPSGTCFNKLFEIKTLKIGYRIDRFSHLSELDCFGLWEPRGGIYRENGKQTRTEI